MLKNLFMKDSINVICNTMGVGENDRGLLSCSLRDFVRDSWMKLPIHEFC